MPTVQDLITLALKDAGITGLGRTPSSTDINDALTRLNWMLDQWQVKRWNVWHTIDVAFVSTGAVSYTVGPGGQFNVGYRPDKLEAAFFRQITPPNPNQVDYTVEVLDSRDDYNRIALKSMSSFPMYVFYDAALPLGNVFYWPVPNAAIYELHLTLKELISNVILTTNLSTLPPSYYAALHSNLTCILRDAYGLPAKPMLVLKAKGDLNTIKVANTQIGRLTVPRELIRGGIYNPYSDRVR